MEASTAQRSQRRRSPRSCSACRMDKAALRPLGSLFPSALLEAGGGAFLPQLGPSGGPASKAHLAEERLMEESRLQEAKVKTLMRSIGDLQKENLKLKKQGTEFRRTALFKDLQIELGRQDAIIAALEKQAGKETAQPIMERAVQALQGNPYEQHHGCCSSCGAHGRANFQDRPDSQGVDLFRSDHDAIFCKACYFQHCWSVPPSSAKVTTAEGLRRPAMKQDLQTALDASRRVLTARRALLQRKREELQIARQRREVSQTPGTVAVSSDFATLLTDLRERSHRLGREVASMRHQKNGLEDALKKQTACLSEQVRNGGLDLHSNVVANRDLRSDAWERQSRLRAAELRRVQDDIDMLEKQEAAIERQAHPLRDEQGALSQEISRLRGESSVGSEQHEARQRRWKQERFRTEEMEQAVVNLRLNVGRARHECASLQGSAWRDRKKALSEHRAAQAEEREKVLSELEDADYEATSRREAALERRLGALEDAEAALDDADFVFEELRDEVQQLSAANSAWVSESREATATRSRSLRLHEEETARMLKELQDRQRLAEHIRTTEIPAVHARNNLLKSEMSSLKADSDAAAAALKTAESASRGWAEEAAAEEQQQRRRGGRAHDLRNEIQEEQAKAESSIELLRSDFEAVLRLRQVLASIAGNPEPQPGPAVVGVGGGTAAGGGGCQGSQDDIADLEAGSAPFHLEFPVGGDDEAAEAALEVLRLRHDVAALKSEFAGWHHLEKVLATSADLTASTSLHAEQALSKNVQDAKSRLTDAEDLRWSLEGDITGLYDRVNAARMVLRQADRRCLACGASTTSRGTS